LFDEQRRSGLTEIVAGVAIRAIPGIGRFDGALALG